MRRGAAMGEVDPIFHAGVGHFHGNEVGPAIPWTSCTEQHLYIPPGYGKNRAENEVGLARVWTQRSCVELEDVGGGEEFPPVVEVHMSTG